ERARQSRASVAPPRCMSRPVYTICDAHTASRPSLFAAALVGVHRRPPGWIIGFEETIGEPMPDTALGSEDGSTAIDGLSLGAKFVGLTAGLILLLSLTAFISLRNSAETVRQFGSVVDFAIPAYGALARSHIRSLEQAMELRRSLLLSLDPTVADDAIAKHVKAFHRAQSAFHREVADPEALL